MRPLLATLVAIVMIPVLVRAARAGVAAAAERALDEGRVEDAAGILREALALEPKDPETLLALALVAAEVKDVEVLERLQGLAEPLLSSVDDRRLDLALGFGSLALAEAHIERQDGSRSVPFLFDDAERLAKKAMASPDHAGMGLWLLARTHYAQGDRAGAVAVLASRDEGGPCEPLLGALLGTLLYERAVGSGLGSDGQPTEAGRKDLEAAVERLAKALGGGAVSGRERAFQATMRLAWSDHRLGRRDDARAAYVSALGLRPDSVLPLRGLESLFTGDAAALTAALEAAVEAHPDHAAAWENLARARLRSGDAAGALVASQRLIALPGSGARGWLLGGGLLLDLKQWGEAKKHFAKAFAIEPGSLEAASGMERAAQGLVPTDLERALTIYDELLLLRPDDPYVRNNLGFVLREVVSPWTDMAQSGLQRLKPEAPPRIRKVLERCAEVYGEAVARIPEEKDKDLDEMEAWNLAGIVNDYALIIHYFVDVQDAPRAEALYLRVLAMTGYGFKDTYSPNLQRLYAFVLPGREMTWYRAAMKAKDAILLERQDASGRTVLAPDDNKRAAAAKDAETLRARILKELESDAKDR